MAARGGPTASAAISTSLTRAPLIPSAWRHTPCKSSRCAHWSHDQQFPLTHPLHSRSRPAPRAFNLSRGASCRYRRPLPFFLILPLFSVRRVSQIPICRWRRLAHDGPFRSPPHRSNITPRRYAGLVFLHDSLSDLGAPPLPVFSPRKKQSTKPPTAIPHNRGSGGPRSGYKRQSDPGGWHLQRRW